MEFHDDMKLAQARHELFNLITDFRVGVECPCCRQYAKMYRRKVNSSMARGLIEMYRAYGLRYGNLQEVRRKRGATDNREESKLRYWGLVEEDLHPRDDGGRSGFWRVTERGESWVNGCITIPKYAYLYDGECMSVSGDPVDIHDALGQKFSYRDLMIGV